MKDSNTQNSTTWKRHKRLPFALITAKSCFYPMVTDVCYQVVTIKFLGIPIYRMVNKSNNP